jgi:CsoR family transcriptional regulator, copper-sensing transcriptional repressor
VETAHRGQLLSDPLHGLDRQPAGSRPSGSDALSITNRLRAIEDEIRELDRMVAQDAPCIDVLTRVAAAQTALEQVAAVLLENHVRRWATLAVTDDDRSRADEKVDELMAAVRRFAKHP